MAVNVGTVEVLLELRDLLKQQAAQTTAVLSRLEKSAIQTTAATDRLGKSHDRSASSIDKFGRQIKTTLVHVFAAGAAYKLLGAAVDSIGKSVEFVRTFEKIENITGVARAEVERLRGSINELSTATGKGPQELAEGFYFIASAGLKGAEATEVLTESARASAVGLGDTAVIARSITSALNAYGKENLSAAQAANQLFVTVREGGAEASEVAGVFGRIVGIANEMGVSFAEVGASIATFTRLGVGADEAVTALRGTLSTLLKPDKQTREAIDGLASAFGRTSMSAADLRQEIKERGLADVLITLNKATGGNVEVMGRLIPNIRALAGVLGNTGQQADAYREILQQMTSDSTALSTAFTDVSQSASFRWDVLKAQFEQLSLTLGEHLLPGVEAFGRALASMDQQQLIQLGKDAASVIAALAKVVQLLVENLDVLKAALVGIIGVKITSSLQAWAIGLDTVAKTTAATSAQTAALARSIGLFGGVISVAIAAFVLLRSTIQESIRQNQADIEKLVNEVNALGYAFEIARKKAAGLRSEAAEYVQLGKDLANEVTQLEALDRKMEELRRKPQTESAGLRGERGELIMRKTEAAMELERLEEERKHLAAIVGAHSKLQQSITRTQVVTGEWASETDKQLKKAGFVFDAVKGGFTAVGKITEEQKAKLAALGMSWDAVWGVVVEGVETVTPKLTSFGNKINEVTTALRDQAALAKANLEAAKARLAGTDEADAARALTVEMRTQLEINKAILGIENEKLKMLPAQRAEVVALVTARVRDEAATKEIEKTIKQQSIEMRNQERALAQMYGIAEKRAAAERRISSELKEQALDLQESLAIAYEEIDVSKKILAALVAGDRQAAHSLQLQHQFLVEHGDANVDLANAMAAAAAEQDKLNYLIERMGELAKPAWQIYYDAAFSVIDSIGNALSDAIVEAGMTGKVEWENIWESLKQTLLQIFADMLAEMLKRWITTQLAMRAASQSINAGGAAGGGGGGISAGSAGSAGGTANSMGVSGSTLAGAALIAYGLFVVYKGFIEDHKRKFAGVTLNEFGQISSTASHGKKYMDGLLKTVDALLSSLRAWLDEFDIEMKKFASITIEADKSGFAAYMGATVIGHFKTAEEAISAAQAFMIRFGEFADSVPELVRAAIRSSDLNMESITSNVNFARQLLTQNMEQIGLAIHDSTELFLEQMRRSFELFGQVGRNFNPQALMEATGSAILYFTNSLQELYNQLTGHKEDPREAAERQRLAYNAQRAIMIAQITLLYEEIRARIAAVQAQIAFINMLREGGYGGSTPQVGGGQRSGGGLGAGNPFPGVNYWWMKGGGAFRQDDRNPTNDPQLAALLQILDNLARVLAGLPPEIGEGGVKPGRRGGGGGRAQGVRDFIDDQRFQLAQAGRSPLQQEIESIRRSFAEQLEAAGKNVKLRQELLALEQESIAAARQRFQEDVENRFKEITGQSNSFTELRKRFADMRRDINEAGFAASRAAVMLAELAEAEREAVDVLSQQMAGDLLGGLAQYIEDEKVRAEFLKQAAFIKFTLDMANYKAQFAILRAMGTLAPEVLDGIQKAFDWIEANPPTFPGTSGGGGTGGDTATPPPFTGTFTGERTVWDGWVWTWNGTNWIQGNQHIPPQGGGSPGGGSGSTTADSIRRAQELLQRYRDEGMNRWQRALTELNRDFEEIRRWLGDTPEIALAYADALHRLREEFLEGLRDYYNELRNFGASQSVAQQFAAARTQYNQLLSAVEGGDLSQAGALQTAAQQLEQLAQQMFGTATGGYQGIRQMILADLESILGIVSPAGNNVIGGPEWFASGNAAALAASNNIANVVSLSGASRDQWLQRIDEKLGRLAGDAAEPIDETTPFSYGDQPRRLPGRG